MTELEINLNSILSEKNTKIIPENIKEGVNILGVEGTLAQSSGNTEIIINTGEETKTGRIIDGKYEYVKRFKFTNINSTADHSQSLGFKLSDVTIIGTEAIMYAASGNAFSVPAPPYTSSNFGHSANIVFDGQNNVIVLKMLNANMSYAYVNLYYTKNS